MYGSSIVSIVVTGATGKLGRLVVAALLERGVAADDIVAAVRTPAKAADLATRGCGYARRTTPSQPH
jgi:NAD(P)H dehydrogenase (quinone)